MSEGGTRFDTLGTETWRVEGTVDRGGRPVPVLHVVRADAVGMVTDRARCAVVVEVEALSHAHWDRWEDAVRDDLAAQAVQSARPPGQPGPPPGRHGPESSVLMAPQEIVTLRIETLDGTCPALDAWVTADPMAGGVSSLLVRADVFQAEALGVAQGTPPAQADRFESDLWLFAGGVGPYFRGRHIETPDGWVEDRFHRLTHARVGDVVLGRPFGVDVGGQADRVEPAPAGGVAFVSAGPNPFRDRLTIRFRVPAAPSGWTCSTPWADASRERTWARARPGRSSTWSRATGWRRACT